MGTRTLAKASAITEAGRLRAYIAALPPDRRRVLKALRATLRAVVPSAADAFSYSIPALRLNGRILLWYAAWKQHVSLYPVSTAMKRELGAPLTKFLAAKGTVRFPLDAPLPIALIRGLVNLRVAELMVSTYKAAGSRSRV